MSKMIQDKRELNITMAGSGGKSLYKLEMPIEQFVEAVTKENARLRAVLESIAEGGMGDTLEDAYMDVLRQAREALK